MSTYWSAIATATAPVATRLHWDELGDPRLRGVLASTTTAEYIDEENAPGSGLGRRRRSRPAGPDDRWYAEQSMPRERQRPGLPHPSIRARGRSSSSPPADRSNAAGT